MEGFNLPKSKSENGTLFVEAKTRLQLMRWKNKMVSECVRQAKTEPITFVCISQNIAPSSPPHVLSPLINPWYAKKRPKTRPLRKYQDI